MVGFKVFFFALPMLEYSGPENGRIYGLWLRYNALVVIGCFLILASRHLDLWRILIVVD